MSSLRRQTSDGSSDEEDHGEREDDDAATGHEEEDRSSLPTIFSSSKRFAKKTVTRSAVRHPPHPSSSSRRRVSSAQQRRPRQRSASASSASLASRQRLSEEEHREAADSERRTPSAVRRSHGVDEYTSAIARENETSQTRSHGDTRSRNSNQHTSGSSRRTDMQQLTTSLSSLAALPVPSTLSTSPISTTLTQQPAPFDWITSLLPKPLPRPEPETMTESERRIYVQRYNFDIEKLDGYVPPGRNPRHWGFHKWVNYGIRLVILLYPYKNRPTTPVYKGTLQLFVSIQPFILPCITCRKSFATAIAKKDVYTFVHDLWSMMQYMNYVHNRVNTKFNHNTANDALPRKKEWSDNEHMMAYAELLGSDFKLVKDGRGGSSSSSSSSKKHPLQLAVTEGRLVEPPVAAIEMFFNALYYSTEHYPQPCPPERDDVTNRRIQHRINMALWCHLWPMGSLIRNELTRVFDLGESFNAMHAREGASPSIDMAISKVRFIMQHEELQERSAPGSTKLSTVWYNASSLTLALYQVECAVLGVAGRISLSERKEIVRQSLSVPAIPIVCESDTKV